MNKCQHNEKITTFCISQHCQWKQASGCSNCIKKYHNHYGDSKFVQQEEILQIINKCSSQLSAKPNCRKIQQLLYSCITTLKNQFNNGLDNLCKTLINHIGEPYLAENNLLTVYKRIKNKQYKRLQQKQFKRFYETTKKLSSTEINKDQNKRYKQQLHKSSKLLSILQNIVTTFQLLFKPFNQIFNHQKNLFNGVNTLIKQTLDNSQLSINLTQFHQKQIEKNRAERALKQQKSQKIDSKKILNQNDSILSTQYSSRLPSSTKQKLTKALDTNLTPPKKRQDSLQQPTVHKFGVRDFATLQKPQTKQPIIKRPNSLDKKIAPTDLSVQISHKNSTKRSDFSLIDDFKNDLKTERQKINLPQKRQTFFNDIYTDSSTKKYEQLAPTLIDKRQSVLKDNEISLRKQQLIQMMKNNSTPLKNLEKEKNHDVEASYHSAAKNIQQKAMNNNSLLIKPSTIQFTKQINPRRNTSLLFEQKKKPVASSINEEKFKFQQKKTKIQKQPIQNQYQTLGTSNSSRLQSLKTPLQKHEISSIRHIPQNEQKSSHGSLQVIKKNLPKKNMNAHPKLPIEQIEEKPKQIACSRLIIVSTNSKFPLDKEEQCDSPLIRKKNNAPKNSRLSVKNQRKQSPVQSKQQRSDLKQSEQKSLNLLIKSIRLKPEQAITALQSALKEAPNNLSAAQYLSFLYLQKNKPKEALNVCNLILDRFEIITKQNEELLINLENNKSAALNMLGRYSEAVVLLQRCIKLQQKDTLFKNLGDAYYFGSNYQKAVFYYEKVIKITPTYDQACFNMAVCLYLQNNFHNAKQSVLKAIQISPKNYQYLQLRKHIQERISQSVSQ